MLVLKDKEDSLRILIHPDFRTIVLPEDSTYLDSLLKDFLERAKLHPAALFKHLSSLGVGPLVTQEVGSYPSEDPSIRELSSRFLGVCRA